MTGQKRIYFLLSILVVISILMVPLAANAGKMTISGKLEGLTCLIKGYVCPLDKADPMINLERDFVLLTADGKHYFLTNVGLGLKARYALQVVDVTGDVNEKYKSIKVDTFKVGGKVVWTPKMEEDMLRQMMGPIAK